jgi:hypothetical protein
MSQTAFKLVVAGGIAVASGLLALYKFSIEPIVLDDADGLGLVPGSSSMAGGSLTSSGSVSPDFSSLKRSPSPSPQLGMSRLGSFSTLATLAEEDEEDYEQGYSPLKSSAAAAAASASGAATASAFASEEELDWGDEADSPSKPACNASSIGATEERGRLEIPPGELLPRVQTLAVLSCDVQSSSCSCGPTKLALTQCTSPSSCALSLNPCPPRPITVQCSPSRTHFLTRLPSQSASVLGSVAAGARCSPPAFFEQRPPRTATAARQRIAAAAHRALAC